jgi:hypothetical protein
MRSSRIVLGDVFALDNVRNRKLVSRRKFLGTLLAGGVGVMSWPIRSAGAEEITPLYCSWINSGLIRCLGGVLEQRWDFLCCEGIGCELWDSEWRAVGTC